MSGKTRRILLDSKLKEILGSDNVYYRAPESKKMNYPAFKYKMSGISEKYADNKSYLNNVEYEVIYIDKNPDRNIHEVMLKEFEKIRWVRRYESNNLNHDVFNLYW